MIKHQNALGLFYGFMILAALSPQTGLAGTVLLEDSFNRPDEADINKGLPQGQSGALRNTPWIEVQNTEHEHDKSNISNGQLLLAYGIGESAALPAHNFVDPIIQQAGGFKVTLDCMELKNHLQDKLDEFYYGFGVGISKVEIAEWDVFYKGKTFRTNGKIQTSPLQEAPLGADFWIGFSKEPAIQIFSSGQLLESIPVNRDDGIIEASFAMKSGFKAGNQVEVSVKINGTPIDINSSSTSTSRIFAWSTDNSNFIALEAKAKQYGSFQHFKIELLQDVPLTPGALSLMIEPLPTLASLSDKQMTSTQIPVSQAPSLLAPGNEPSPKIVIPGTRTTTSAPAPIVTPSAGKTSLSQNNEIRPSQLTGLIIPLLLILLRKEFD